MHRLPRGKRCPRRAAARADPRAAAPARRALPCELAAACELNELQLRAALDKLLREELLVIRNGLLFLTGEGKFAADWLDYLLDGADELLAVGLSEEERQRLLTLLSRIYRNLRGEPIYPQIG